MNNIIKPRILVIEDESTMQMILKEYLSSTYSVNVAPNAKQACEELKNRSFDIALVDLNLPDATGIDIVKVIAKDHKKTAILVLTGDMFQKTVQVARDAGANDYIIKPIEKKILLERIAKVMRLRLQQS